MAKIGGYSLAGGVGALGRHYYRSPSFSRPWSGLRGLANVGQSAIATAKSVATVDGARAAGGVITGRVLANTVESLVAKALGNKLPAKDTVAGDAVRVVIDVLSGVIAAEALRRVPKTGRMSEFALYGAATRTLSRKAEKAVDGLIVGAGLPTSLGDVSDIQDLIAALSDDNDISGLSDVVLPADSMISDTGEVLLPMDSNIADVVIPAEYGISETEDSLF